MTRSLCGSSCAIDTGIISLRRAQVSNLVRLTRRAFREITSFQRDSEGTPRLNQDGTPTGSPGDRVCFQGATTFRRDTENSYTYNPNDPDNPIPHRGTRRCQCGTLQRKDIGLDFTDGRRREHLRRPT